MRWNHRNYHVNEIGKSIIHIILEFGDRESAPFEPFDTLKNDILILVPVDIQFRLIKWNAISLKHWLFWTSDEKIRNRAKEKKLCLANAIAKSENPLKMQHG